MHAIDARRDIVDQLPASVQRVRQRLQTEVGAGVFVLDEANEYGANDLPAPLDRPTPGVARSGATRLSVTWTRQRARRVFAWPRALDDSGYSIT